MSQDKTIGTVSASVRIEKSGLRNDVNDIKTIMSQMATALEQQASQAAARAGAAMKRQQEQAARQAEAALKAQAKRRADIVTDYANKAAKGMTIAGTAIAVSLAAATKQAADFDQAMRNVNSIAKLNERQFRDLSASVKKLADDPSIRQAPEDLAKGLYDVYSSGFEGQKALDILRVSALGASAGMTGTATSSRVLMAVLNSGIKGVTSTQQAMDVLFQEVNLGVNTFEQLASSIGDVLPTAKTAGVSLQEVAASLAAMTRRGINVNEATTALNNLLVHIIKPGKDAAELFDKLGISYGISGLQAHGLTGILQQMSQQTHGNKQALVQLMPEIRALKAILSLTDENGKQYSDMLKGMTDKTQVQGATQKAANEQNKGAVAQYQLLKKEVSLVAIEIGEHLLPIGLRLLKWIRDQIQWFRNLDDGTKRTITQIALFGSGLLIAGGAVVKLITWTAQLRTALISLGIVGETAGAKIAGGMATALGSVKSFVAGAGGIVTGGIGLGFLGLNKFADENAKIVNDSNKQLYAESNAAEKRKPDYLQKRLNLLKIQKEGIPRFRAQMEEEKAISPTMYANRQQRLAEMKADMRQTYADIAEARKNAQPTASKPGKPPKNPAADAAARQAQAEIDKILAGLKNSKGHGGGGGRSGKTAGERAAAKAERVRESAAKDAEQKQRDLEQLNDEILAASPGVTEAQIERRRIGRRYQENLRNGMPQQKALDLWTKEHAKVDAEQRQAALDAARERNEKRDEAGKAKFDANIDRGMTGLRAQMDVEDWQKQKGMGMLGKFLQGYSNAKDTQGAIDRQEREKDEAREEEIRKDKELKDKQFAWESQYNLISLSQYKAYLNMRLGSLQEFSEEWMEVQGKIFEIEERQKDAQAKAEEKRMERIKSLRESFQNVFVSAFENLLNGGKGFFQSLLDGFKQMIAQMIAQALAAKLMKSLFGGGSGFFGGLLGTFGFDDAHNDRIAERWGRDAMTHALNGAAWASRLQSPRMASSVNITVNMGGVTMGANGDARDLANEIAWHVQQRLPYVRR